MNTPDALLAAILHAPADDAPRLIYADCLDDSGEGAKAEFIRVQCELARLERKHYIECTSTTVRSMETSALRRREAELFPGDRLYYGKGDYDYITVKPSDFQRGFVSHVTLPTALFIGGVCERCEGPGHQTSDRNSEDGHPCPVCNGDPNYRTVGISGPLFAREPVTGVTLSDREPAGHSKTWWWFFPASVGLVANAGNHLPDILIPFFDKGCFGGHIYYDSRDLALAALSSAAVALGRAAATDCTHEVECETCERTGKVKPYPVRYRTSLFRGARRQTDLCPACDGTGRVVRAGLPPLVNHKATSEAP